MAISNEPGYTVVGSSEVPGPAASKLDQEVIQSRILVGVPLSQSSSRLRMLSCRRPEAWRIWSASLADNRPNCWSRATIASSVMSDVTAIHFFPAVHEASATFNGARRAASLTEGSPELCTSAHKPSTPSKLA